MRLLELGRRVKAAPARALLFPIVLLLIELLDELIFGAREAAWPLIRDDLSLSYWQIGLLLGVPNVLSNLIELPLGVLGDFWPRRRLVVGGGLLVSLALLLMALAPSFVPLLLAFILIYPASGAFVGLAQATLMDLEPTRHEVAMARWTLAGSLGNVVGPLLLGVASWLLWGWRGLFLAFALLSFLLTLLAARQRFPQLPPPASSSFKTEFGAAWAELRRPAIRRWLFLLECSDLMLDVLLGFLALYFVDVVGVKPATAGLAVTIWLGVGLLGDALLIPLLGRVAGLRYLRASALILLVLYPAFLLTPWLSAKLLLLALVGLFNAGWYAILKGQLYSAMPGRSGSVMTMRAAAGMVGGALPALLGLIAQEVSLELTMWLLLFGPLVLLLGLPSEARQDVGDGDNPA